MSFEIGLWARSKTVPFGTGRSHTGHLPEVQAKAAGFVPERRVAALCIPPSDRCLVIAAHGGTARVRGR